MCNINFSILSGVKALQLLSISFGSCGLFSETLDVLNNDDKYLIYCIMVVGTFLVINYSSIIIKKTKSKQQMNENKSESSKSIWRKWENLDLRIMLLKHARLDFLWLFLCRMNFWSSKVDVTMTSASKRMYPDCRKCLMWADMNAFKKLLKP